MKLKQWFSGLRGRLLILVLIPVAALTIVAWIGVKGLIELDQSLDNAGLVRAPKIMSMGEMDSAHNAVIRWLWASKDSDSPTLRKKFLERARGESSSFEKSREHYRTLHHNEKEEANFKIIDEQWNKARGPINEAIELLEKNNKHDDEAARTIMVTAIRSAFEPMEETFESSLQVTTELIKTSLQVEGDRSDQLRSLAISMSIAGGIFVLLFGFFTAARLAKLLGSIAQKIGDSSSQVASAAHQVSASAQQLASGASEQASAVEETSASLEEITGMVENTTRNAETGLQLVEGVKTASERGNQAMTNLINAMGEVLASNKKIEQLVKVIDEIGEKTAIIDEIVFQTKLLSFNASVEAERAGEHGRGFAVVAQEVGNLAQMSGKAALEISGIVKSSIKEAQEIAGNNRSKVEKGNEHVREAGDILKEILKSAETVCAGSRQILSASKEQAAGIKQINTAIDNINKATQETASTSEESASAGEELSGQSHHLAKLVEDLNTVISGHERTSSDDIVLEKRPQTIPHNNLVRLKPVQKAPVHFKKAVGDESESHGQSVGNSEWEKL